MEMPFADFERWNKGEGRLSLGREFGHRVVELTHISSDDVEEANVHLDIRIEAALKQALRLHPACGAFLGLTMIPRINPPAGPALTILHARGPVGVEDVALIQNRSDYGLNAREVHDKALSRCFFRRECMVCSQVVNPCCRL